MSKQCLDIEQMQHLQKLGLDTSNASMLYCDLYDETYILVESKHRFDKEENAILLEGVRNSVIYCKKVTPVYTLQDVLDVLPKCIEDKRGDEYCMDIYRSFKKWVVGYSLYDEVVDDAFFRHDNLIDSAYEALCWCIEKGYINTKKED